MKVKLYFDDIESEAEEFIADLLYAVVDAIMNTFQDDKKEEN